MKQTAIAISLLACSGVVLAENNNADLEAYIGAAQYFWDGDRNLDDSSSLEGGLELPVSDRVSLEAWLSDFDAELENSNAEADGRRYSLGGLYHFSDSDVRPFVSLGGSHLEFENAASQKADESLVQLGLGAKKYFDSNIILRGEVLAMNSLDNELTDVAARLTLGYAFGRSAGSSASEAAVAAPVAEQAPTPAPKAEPAPEPVSVAPAEAAPAAVVPVVAVAPPADSDKDGVIDSQDQCADTNEAFKVDDKGCPVMLTETVSIQMHVTFQTNSAEVGTENDAELQKVADFMAQFEGTRLTVEGHTDDRGRAAYNKSLSQKRADAVRQTLISRFGLAEDRVSAVGYGEEQPLVSNDTKEGRAQNRRVVGVIESTQQRAVTK